MTDNELIAEFMGLQKNPHDGGKTWANELIKDSDNRVYSDKWMILMYDKSWDWLIPVVEKIHTPEISEDGNRIIRSDADVTIFYKACQIQYNADEDSGDERGEWSTHQQGETKLEAVYKAVVEFIKWYNQ